MKKRWFLLLPFLLIILCLSACNPLQEKQWREKAEEHLSKLQKKVGDADHFTLRSGSASGSDHSTHAIFTVDSEIYGGSFSLYVTRDASSCEDDYYRLYLKAEVEDRANALIKEALGNEAPKVSADLLPAVGLADFSLHKLNSLDEFLEQIGRSLLLTVRLASDGKTSLTEEQTDRLLLALQEAGLYCKLYPYPSDSVFFEILNDGFWKTTQSGADKGSYMERKAYEPQQKR